MTDKDQDPMQECEGCGHLRYHHRPECTYRPTMLRNSPRSCNCITFEEFRHD